MSGRSEAKGRGRILPTALAVVLVVAGLSALIVGWLGQRPDPPQVARDAAHAVASPSESTDDPSAATEGGVSTPTSPSSADDAPVAEEPAAAETPEPLPRSEPVAVRIPTASVSSPLHPLGLADDGSLEVPSGERYDEAAWYAGSPTPGEVGPTVIEGHVTGAGGRASIFFELAALEVGDLAEVERADGQVVEFEVYRLEQVPKAEFPTVAVYGPTDGPELRLITCGGEFDSSTGHHVDNTVVFARMIGAD